MDESLEGIGSVYGGGLVQLLRQREEKLPVEEDIVGAAAQYGRNDQGPVGIHHPHLEVQQVLGNQRYLGRQHHGRHQAGIPELGSGGREFGKTVSYHCGREHGCNRVDQDKKDGIFREQSEISHLEAVAEIGEQPSCRDESRGKRIGLRRRFKCGGQHPEKRENTYHCTGDQNKVSDCHTDSSGSCLGHLTFIHIYTPFLRCYCLNLLRLRLYSFQIAA